MTYLAELGHLLGITLLVFVCFFVRPIVLKTNLDSTYQAEIQHTAQGVPTAV